MIDKPLGGLNMTEIPSEVIHTVFDVKYLSSQAIFTLILFVTAYQCLSTQLLVLQPGGLV